MSEALRPATHARHYAEPPQKTDADGTRHWITRAANFVTVVSQAPTGAVLARNNPDEYMALLPPGTEAVAVADGTRVEMISRERCSEFCQRCNWGGSDPDRALQSEIWHAQRFGAGEWMPLSAENFLLVVENLFHGVPAPNFAPAADQHKNRGQSYLAGSGVRDPARKCIRTSRAGSGTFCGRTMRASLSHRSPVLVSPVLPGQE
jgi:hypothetical protein